MTASQLAAKITAHPALADKLDRTPYETRAKAEKRRSELQASSDLAF
jgi:hypothetical protein